MSPFILIIFSIIIISMLILTISMTILTIKLVIHIMFIRWSLWSSSCSSGGWRALWRAVPLVGCKGSWAMAWTRGFSSFFFFYVICHAITCRYLDWAMAWTSSFFTIIFCYVSSIMITCHFVPCHFLGQFNTSSFFLKKWHEKNDIKLCQRISKMKKCNLKCFLIIVFVVHITLSWHVN